MLLHIQEILDKQWMYAKDLAKAIGCTRQTMSNYIHGRTFPNEDTLRDIASALGVPVWELFLDPSEDVPYLGHDDKYHCPHCNEPIRFFVGKA